ncbi:hypothetical protein F4560_001091 [Saccharothrix ecbatanensis]|uniref:Uncharacterized protein n=1 Tax=Saccharothrix ecbatanensis TaxID=1105145 RepID=A0A7W9HG38_9PSEU|nr:hypothetical protein [Saccharothrix ecbatanensis]
MSDQPAEARESCGCSCRPRAAVRCRRLGRDRSRIFAITCPFHGNSGWRWIRDNDPDGWAEAVEFDRAIRRGHPRATAQGRPLRGQYLLHRSYLPLDQVDLDAPAKRRRHHRLLAVDPVEEADPDGCSPWTCRSGASVDTEAAA